MCRNETRAPPTPSNSLRVNMIGDSQNPKPNPARRFWLYTSPVLAIAIAYSGWIMLSRWQENKQLTDQAAAQARAKEKQEAQQTVESLGGDRFDILSFYATPGAIRRGESAQLCYGVSNAKTVTLDPPVAEMWPSASRCLDVTPTRTTNYTLTATDAQGNKKTVAVELKVQ
jgi:hypothetical protein